MESDEDDGQGVYLDPNGYAYRDPRQRGYVGDELYFTGHDLGQHRRGSYPNAYYGEGEEDEDGYYNGRDEALAQAAYERIAKARASGQTNINLSVDEMEAIERRRGVQQLAPVQPPPLQIASPPATPVKTPKGKSSSRNNSSVSLSSTKAKKKGSSLFGGGTPSTPPSKSKSKSKSSRKMSVSSDQAAPFSPPTIPPPHGYMVPGPNGMPMYAQAMPYYPPPSPELARAQATSTRDRSRSTSKHNRRGSTPPEPVFAPYPTRFYPGPQGAMRPGSSGSNRSFHDEAPDWYPPLQPAGRTRAGSNAAHAQYRMPQDEYAGPPMPAAHGSGRRSMGGSPASGMADINYSSLRRVPPGSSPLASSQARPGASHMHYYGDPAAASRKGSGLSQEVDSGSSSGSSSSEDQGVQVIPEREVKGKTTAKSSSAGDARRRKSKR